jgi:hypothetical protein
MELVQVNRADPMCHPDLLLLLEGKSDRQRDLLMTFARLDGK